MISCLILGSGPAGYTAAIYAGRSGLQPVIYEGLQPGGQLTITTEIENYPGFPEGIDANEMMDDMRKQALRFGTEIRPASAVKVDLSQAPYKVWFDDDTMEECQTLIIATGASAKYLGLADEKKYQIFLSIVNCFFSQFPVIRKAFRIGCRRVFRPSATYFTKKGLIVL